MDDHDIIKLYFSRNEKAISETSKKYGSRIFALSLSITEDRLDSEECLNDTYMRLWHSIPPAEPKNLFAFIARIARNVSLNTVKRRSVGKRQTQIVELTHELEECLPDTEIEADELRPALNEFLRLLDSDAQYIFIRRYFCSEQVKSIAWRMGKSETAVASLLYRTRKQLKAHLDRKGIKL